MKTSPEEQVRGLYESTAHDYAAMMDAEIDLPLYTSVLGKLKTKLDNTQGLLIIRDDHTVVPAESVLGSLNLSLR